ncbi:pirin family protein [Gordonia soli]|uniref:Pirin N-terminal domain-containing protein n=1 Tax=Gordonia soli NBRC 108243 TaxID=1223545 RepID=M0QJA7_9ACTN|nr:pirin family protein [Gordonia soli]GAC68534.1 hypothetical protein GS4_16_00640 [Gordonia soli NBRC 108243]
MIRLIRADDRHHWWNEWLDSRQSFPATGNFDLAANAHGVLLVHNDDRVESGEGLDTHQHRDTEILTWVVDGSAAHRDSAGNESVIRPGEIQRMTAGRGIRHSERNPEPRSADDTLRVIQMWVAPDTAGLDPSYEQRDMTGELASGKPIVIASGRPEHASGPSVTVANRHAVLHAARPAAGSTISLPGAPFGHLFVVRGAVTVPDVGDLSEGDALRLTDHPDIDLIATTDAEILYWQMDARAS